MLLLGRRGWPIFAISFSWAIGTGALYVARPLFAAELGASVFFVVLVNTAGTIARPLLAPVSGLLMDRVGRRPVLLGGSLLNGLAALSQTFVSGYLEFVLLEFVAGVGRGFYFPANSVLLADFTDETNRGRASALRNAAGRLGSIGGPAIAGLVALLFGLRAVFAYQALTKFVVFLIVLFFVRETAPAESRAGRPGPASAPLRALFATRTFAVLAFATVCISMMSDGLFGAIFPVYARDAAALTTSEIASLITLGGIATLLVSAPSGILMDRYGRKKNLFAGLVALAVAALLLARMTDLPSATMVVLVYGVGHGFSSGASLVYAMDLAPAPQRGAFLGTWTYSPSSGSLSHPCWWGWQRSWLDCRWRTWDWPPV